MNNAAKRNAVCVFEYVLRTASPVLRDDALYEVNKDDKVLGVYKDDAELTEVFDILDVTDNTKFYVDHKTEKIILFEQQNTFVKYKTYVSSEYYEFDDNGEKIVCDARLKAVPKFIRKVDILTNETIYNSIYSVKLQNTDRFYDNLITNGFFRNEKIEMYSVNNGVIKKLMLGVIEEPSVQGKDLVIKFKEKNVLETMALAPLIDTAPVSLEKFADGAFENIKEEDEKDYKPIIAGRINNLPVKNINQIREDVFEDVLFNLPVLGNGRGKLQIQGSDATIKKALDNIFRSDNLKIKDGPRFTLTPSWFAPEDLFDSSSPIMSSFDPDQDTFGELVVYPPSITERITTSKVLQISKNDGLNFNDKFYVGKIPSANIGLEGSNLNAMLLSFNPTIGSDIAEIKAVFGGGFGSYPEGPKDAKLKVGDNIFISGSLSGNKYFQSAYSIIQVLGDNQYQLDRKVYKVTGSTAYTDIIKKVQVGETILTRDIVEYAFKTDSADNMTQTDTDREQFLLTIPKNQLSAEIVHPDTVGDILQIFWYGHGSTTNTPPTIPHVEQWENVVTLAVQIADGDTSADITQKTMDAINNSATLNNLCHATKDTSANGIEDTIFIRLNSPSKLKQFSYFTGGGFLEAYENAAKRSCFEVRLTGSTYKEIEVHLDRRTLQKEYGKRKDIGYIQFKAEELDGIEKNKRKVIKNNRAAGDTKEIEAGDMIFSFYRQNKEFVVSEVDKEAERTVQTVITGFTNGFVSSVSPTDTLTVTSTEGLNIGDKLENLENNNTVIVDNILNSTTINVRLTRFWTDHTTTNFAVNDQIGVNRLESVDFYVTEPIEYDGTSKSEGYTFAVAPFEIEHDTEVYVDVIDGKAGYGVKRILEDISSNIYGLDVATPDQRERFDFESLADIDEEIGIVIKENIPYYEVLKMFLRSFDNVAFIKLTNDGEDFSITTKAITLDEINEDSIIPRSQVIDYDLSVNDKILNILKVGTDKDYKEDMFTVTDKTESSFILNNIIAREESSDINTLVTKESPSYLDNYFGKYFRKQYTVKIKTKNDLLDLELMDKVKLKDVNGIDNERVFFVTEIQTDGYNSLITVSTFPELTAQTFFIVDENGNFIVDQLDNNLIGGV